MPTTVTKLGSLVVVVSMHILRVDDGRRPNDWDAEEDGPACLHVCIQCIPPTAASEYSNRNIGTVSSHSTSNILLHIQISSHVSRWVSRRQAATASNERRMWVCEVWVSMCVCARLTTHDRLFGVHQVRLTLDPFHKVCEYVTSQSVSTPTHRQYVMENGECTSSFRYKGAQNQDETLWWPTRQEDEDIHNRCSHGKAESAAKVTTGGQVGWQCGGKPMTF